MPTLTWLRRAPQGMRLRACHDLERCPLQAWGTDVQVSDMRIEAVVDVAGLVIALLLVAFVLVWLAGSTLGFLA